MKGGGFPISSRPSSARLPASYFKQRILMALYGIYGSHTIEVCPVNDRGTAKTLVEFVDADLTPLFKEYKIQDVLGQYHSAFEHTFLWVIDTEDPHLPETYQ